MRLAIDGASRGERQVLGPIAFDLGAREVLGVVGPSGVGKTTLLRIVAGLHAPDGGGVFGGGPVGVVFQEPTLLPWRTVAENLTLLARIGSEEAERALADVGLEGLGSAFPGALSLGQARRVALARALAVRPDTLLLDEPFVSLDRGAAGRLRRLIAGILADRPMRAILVTHMAEDCAWLADRVIRLGGAPAGVVAERTLERPRPDRDSDDVARLARQLDAETAAEDGAGADAY